MLTDPLKNKFKKCVLKFYPEDMKNSISKAEEKLNEIRNHPSITFFKSYPDYCDKIRGNRIHFNIILKSSQYKVLLKKYNNLGKEKDPTCFLYMKDIEDTSTFIAFIEYCTFRERTNWYNYLKSQQSSICFDDVDTDSSVIGIIDIPC